MTDVYTRGTKTVRVKTARLVPGDRVLTQPAVVLVRDAEGRMVRGENESGQTVYLTEPHPDPLVVRDAQTKTGATIRTVERLVARATRGNGRRAGREYIVHFTDGTRAEHLAPILTWHALDVDRESSAARQCYIEEGFYPTADELAEALANQRDLEDSALAAEYEQEAALEAQHQAELLAAHRAGRI